MVVVSPTGFIWLGSAVLLLLILLISKAAKIGLVWIVGQLILPFSIHNLGVSTLWSVLLFSCLKKSYYEQQSLWVLRACCDPFLVSLQVTFFKGDSLISGALCSRNRILVLATWVEFTKGRENWSQGSFFLLFKNCFQQRFGCFEICLGSFNFGTNLISVVSEPSRSLIVAILKCVSSIKD